MKPKKLLACLIVLLMTVSLFNGLSIDALTAPPDETADTADGTGVTVTGLISSYNPTKPTVIQLLRNGEVRDTITIEPEAGSGQTTQSFAFAGVEPGTYTLVIAKETHASYTVKNIVVGSRPVNLAQVSRSADQLIALPCGDINNDGMINDGDLAVLWLSANYNKSADDAANPKCDLNGDGMVNDSDLAVLWLSANYNKGAVVVEREPEGEEQPDPRLYELPLAEGSDEIPADVERLLMAGLYVEPEDYAYLSSDMSADCFAELANATLGARLSADDIGVYSDEDMDMYSFVWNGISYVYTYCRKGAVHKSAATDVGDTWYVVTNRDNAEVTKHNSGESSTRDSLSDEEFEEFAVMLREGLVPYKDSYSLEEARGYLSEKNKPLSSEEQVTQISTMAFAPLSFQDSEPKSSRPVYIDIMDSFNNSGWKMGPKYKGSYLVSISEPYRVTAQVKVFDSQTAFVAKEETWIFTAGTTVSHIVQTIQVFEALVTKKLGALGLLALGALSEDTSITTEYEYQGIAIREGVTTLASKYLVVLPSNQVPLNVQNRLDANGKQSWTATREQCSARDNLFNESPEAFARNAMQSYFDFSVLLGYDYPGYETLAGGVDLYAHEHIWGYEGCSYTNYNEYVHLVPCLYCEFRVAHYDSHDLETRYTSDGRLYRACPKCLYASDPEEHVKHTFGDWMTYNSSPNVRVRYCNFCGLPDYDSIPEEHTHSFDSWTTYNSSPDVHVRYCTDPDCGSPEYGSHSYSTATCAQKATCKDCGSTFGGYGPHNWGKGTCVSQKCSVCGTVSGNTIHQWYFGACTYMKCNLCQTESGTATHNYSGATCMQKGICRNCNGTGDYAPHNWVKGTCVSQKCSVCGTVSGNTTHQWYFGACTYMKCNLCQTESGTSTHNYSAATCTEKATCKNCGGTTGNPLGHSYRAWAKYSATQHRRSCANGCGLYQYASHTFGPWTNPSGNVRIRICNACGYSQTG